MKGVYILDSDNIYVKFYNLAQKMVSLEDTAIHQSTGETGITILGRGVLSSYGQQVTDLVDDLLLNHSDVPSEDSNGDWWHDDLKQKLDDTNQKLDALKTRNKELFEKNQSLIQKNKLLENMSISDTNDDDLQKENDVLTSENEHLKTELADLKRQLAEGESSASSVDEHLKEDSPEEDSSSENNKDASSQASSLVNSQASKGDQSAVDTIIDQTDAAPDSASSQDEQPKSSQSEHIDVKGNLKSLNLGTDTDASAEDQASASDPNDVPLLNNSGDESLQIPGDDVTEAKLPMEE